MKKIYPFPLVLITMILMCSALPGFGQEKNAASPLPENLFRPGDSITTATIDVFPNPSSGKLFLNLTPVPAGQPEIVVSNLTGKAVIRQKVLQWKPDVLIDLSNSPDGIYFLQVQAAGETYTRKLIVESGR